MSMVIQSFDNLHDNRVLRYCADFEAHTLHMDTQTEAGEKVSVRFTGLLAHWFENVIQDNILFGMDEITVDLENGYLTISAAKGLDKDEEDKKGKYIRKERYAGTMQRSFYVGDAITHEDIKAKFENGILSLTIPKKDAKAVETKKSIAIEG
jgi:hypothetical protein